MGRPAADTRLLLSRSGLERHEAARLLGLVTGHSRREIVSGVPVAGDEQERFEALVNRRKAGEPLQYLEGTAAFGPIEVLVDSRVLVPRPETEQLWERAMAIVAGIGAPNVVDLCTGSGCLALATKHLRPDARVVATDVSADAASVAVENAGRLGLDVDVRVGDLFEALPADLLGRVDLVVANPPYVSEPAWETLPADVRDHEPRLALVAGIDGLDVVRAIAAGVVDWLAPRGAVVMEIGEEQADAVRHLFEDWSAEIETDLSGRPRMLVAMRRP